VASQEGLNSVDLVSLNFETSFAMYLERNGINFWLAFVFISVHERNG
jgi:hypothetical protein